MHQAHRIGPPPSSPPSRALRGRPAAAPLVALAALAGLAFAVLAIVVAGGPLAVDLSVADALRPFSDGVTGILVRLLNLLGQAPAWDSLLVILAAALWMRGHRVEAVVLVAGVLAAEAGATVAKVVVNRQRPPGVAVQDLLTQASYPSGHVTRAVVTTGLLARFAWRWTRHGVAAVVAALALSAAMGASRVAAGEHWFTDVAGAALYGLFALAVIWLIADRLGPRLARTLRELRPG